MSCLAYSYLERTQILSTTKSQVRIRQSVLRPLSTPRKHDFSLLVFGRLALQVAMNPLRCASSTSGM